MCGIVSNVCVCVHVTWCVLADMKGTECIYCGVCGLHGHYPYLISLILWCIVECVELSVSQCCV